MNQLRTAGTEEAQKSESDTASNWIVGMVAGTIIALILFGLVNFIWQSNEADRIESTYGVTISHGIRDDGVKDGKFKVEGRGGSTECIVPRTEAEWSMPLLCKSTTATITETLIAPVRN